MERRSLLTGCAALGAATLLGCSRGSEDRSPSSRPTGGAASPDTPAATTPQVTPAEPRIAGTVASGLNVPWGIAFLASGEALVSQRDEGTIVRVAPDGTVTRLGLVAGSKGTPGGEGGLLGIALDPDDEGVLFAYVTTSTDDRVIRMSVNAQSIGDVEPIVTGIPIGSRHHGGRLLFGQDNALFISTGDAGRGELAQDRDSLAGKILRVDRSGKAVAGNPFGNRTWSYGHRNIEGLALDGAGRLWASEFGEKTADELNLIEPGGNYGWPQIEGIGKDPDRIDPKVTWGTDECSPAGVAILGSTAYVGALQGECLFAVALDGESAGRPTAHLTGELGRVRSVAAAPDGSLWVTSSNTDGRGDPGSDDDRIVRVTV